VRYLYAIQPPVPGFVFSACYYTLAAVTTSFLALQQQQHSTNNDDDEKERLDITQQKLVSDDSFPLLGGIELGSYLFVANCLQVIGLRTVESDRAGFLVQLTTVMVPLAEALFAGKLSEIPVRTWSACMFAFLGLFVMGLDGRDNLSFLQNPVQTLLGAISLFSQGDFLIVGAAVLYTLHVVRLGKYAPRTTPMKLAACKATTETIFSFGIIFLLVSLASSPGGGGTVNSENNLLGFAVETGREITSFTDSFSTGLSDGSIPKSALLSALGAVLWTGWITCAYTIWAQSFGQARVRYVLDDEFNCLYSYNLHWNFSLFQFSLLC
jgi:hypothetical protein